MSYVMMMAPVHLHVGCPLDYIGKRVSFVRYAEVLVGPLDPMGRRPGRYTDRENMIVRYSDGDLRAPVKDVRFVDTYPKPPAAHIPNGFSLVDRLGDLPYPIELWPDDRIKGSGRNQEWFTVVAVLFDDIGRPIYELWNETRSIKLIHHYKPVGGWLDRGNVYHLYNDPEKLKFASDKEELAFWAREGVSVQVSDEWDHSLRSCAKDFELGHVHIVRACTNDRGEDHFRSYKLHDIFKIYKVRVHELTMRVLRNYFKERLSEGQ